MWQLMSECFLQCMYLQYKYYLFTEGLCGFGTPDSCRRGTWSIGGQSDATVTGWLTETWFTDIDESLQHDHSHIKCQIFISEKNEPIPLQEFIKSAALFWESGRGLIIHYSPAALCEKNVIKSIFLNVLLLLHLQCKNETSRPHPCFFRPFFLLFVILWKASSEP